MAGSAESFLHLLYTTQYDKLTKAAYRMIGDIESAQDLVQQVFLLALVRQKELSAHPVPEGWLMLALHNLVKNERRKQKNHPEVPLDDIVGLANQESPVSVEDMLNKLRSAAKGFLRIMTPGKWIALIIAIALLWKPVSFYFILHDMLRPDWDEVTLITSYDTHGTYTEYTEGNGRDLAVEALSHVRLGPPFVLNLAALYHNGGSESYEVVFAFHTEEGVDRICFHETGQAKGFIQGSGAGYPFPYFFSDERYSELLHSSALERTYHGAVKPEEILEQA